MILARNGSVLCGGQNGFGQLGLGDGDIATRYSYVLNPFLNNIKHISCGKDHCLAIDGNRSVLAWGSNGVGQLGLGTTSGGLGYPVFVPGMKSAMKVIAVNIIRYHG